MATIPAHEIVWKGNTLRILEISAVLIQIMLWAIAIYAWFTPTNVLHARDHQSMVDFLSSGIVTTSWILALAGFALGKKIGRSRWIICQQLLSWSLAILPILATTAGLIVMFFGGVAV